MKKYPVIGVTVLYAVGIILQSNFSITIQSNLIIAASALTAAFISFWIERRRGTFGAVSLMLLTTALAAGYISGQLQRSGNHLIPDSIYVINNLAAYGSVEEINLPSTNGFSFILKTDSIKAEQKISTNIKLLCKYEGDNHDIIYSSLKPGNRIKMSGRYRKGNEDRNPGEFNYNKYLHSLGISGTLACYEKENIQIISSETYQVKELILSARKLIDQKIATIHTTQTAALLKGLILGDRNDISDETKDQFIDSGIAHILAVSGLHTGFIAIIFFVLFGRMNLYLRSCLTIAGLLLFMLITGIPASVVRAVIMGVVVIISFLLNRSTSIYNSLAIAALILLTADPQELFNPGFQLSFISVLSIAYLYPRFKYLLDRMKNMNGIVKKIVLLSAVTISAQLGTLPITLLYFGKFSIIALPVNLIVIPLTGIILGTAVTSLIIYPFSLTAASIYAAANNWFADWLFAIVKYAGTLTYSSLDVTNYSRTDAIIFYSFMLSAVILLNYLKSARVVIIFLFLIAGNIYVFTYSGEFKRSGKNKLNILMLDVGQGDSFILKFPDGETAIIDAGNASSYFDSGERIILPVMKEFGIEKFNYGFVSHIDIDHYGGFISLIEKGKIGKILKPRPDSASEKDNRFERYLRKKDIPVEYYSSRYFRVGNAEVFILNDTTENLARSNLLNNSSGLIKIYYGRTSFLFTGDIDKRGENYYRRKYNNFLESDILKVSHHGSKTGSSEEFLKSVSPEISLISCGIKNRFDHPSREVTARLNAAGSEILRTDLEGCIMLQSDGTHTNRIDWKRFY